ncbi:MAG: LPS assembly lipoprotein LptE [Cyclobacteriaceae bacterium]
MRSIIFSLVLISTIFLSNCGIYSFTGASISPSVKTISIQTFYNNAPLGPSNMSATFTEMIKDYYQQNTSLTIVDSNGDLQIDGYVSNYQISPVAANASGSSTGVDYSSLSRITITVFATYINTQDDQYDFERRFSFFKDYDQNESDLSSNEQQFVEEIFDQIILDIFNASVANW